jgi:hypothetical protein
MRHGFIKSRLLKHNGKIKNQISAYGNAIFRGFCKAYGFSRYKPEKELRFRIKQPVLTEIFVGY